MEPEGSFGARTENEAVPDELVVTSPDRDASSKGGFTSTVNLVSVMSDDRPAEAKLPLTAEFTLRLHRGVLLVVVVTGRFVVVVAAVVGLEVGTVVVVVTGLAVVVAFAADVVVVAGATVVLDRTVVVVLATAAARTVVVDFGAAVVEAFAAAAAVLEPVAAAGATVVPTGADVDVVGVTAATDVVESPPIWDPTTTAPPNAATPASTCHSFMLRPFRRTGQRRARRSTRPQREGNCLAPLLAPIGRELVREARCCGIRNV